MTKSEQLLASLKSGRLVTRGTAMLAMKIANLTAEIGTLRRRGHRIEAITSDDGTGAKYTKWVYLGTTAQSRTVKIAISPTTMTINSARRTTTPRPSP